MMGSINYKHSTPSCGLREWWWRPFTLGKVTMAQVYKSIFRYRNTAVSYSFFLSPFFPDRMTKRDEVVLSWSDHITKKRPGGETSSHWNNSGCILIRFPKFLQFKEPLRADAEANFDHNTETYKKRLIATRLWSNSRPLRYKAASYEGK